MSDETVETSAGEATVEEAASTFEPRRGKAGQEIGFTAGDGTQVVMKADDDGVIRPETIEQVRALDGFGLPVARSAKKADEAEKSKKAEG